MGFKAEYTAIFDDIEETIKALPSVKQVIYKEASNKFKLKKFPCAMINPGRFRLDPSDGTLVADVSDYCLDIRGEIIVLIRESDSDDWFDEIIDPIADIVDAIFADQTLGGTCLIAWPHEGGPGEITVQNTLYYGGSIGIRTLKGYP